MSTNIFAPICIYGKIDYTIYYRQAVGYVLKLQRPIEKDKHALKIDIALDFYTNKLYRNIVTTLYVFKMQIVQKFKTKIGVLKT